MSTQESENLLDRRSRTGAESPMVSSEAKFGGVTARFNEDGTLYLYQPDSHRQMSAGLAEQLTAFLAAGLGLPYPLGGSVDVPAILNDLPSEVNDPGEDRFGGANLEPASGTVPAGVINTSEGAATTPKRRAPGRPRKPR